MKRIITILVLVSLFVAGDAWAISGRLGEFGVGDSIDVPYHVLNCSGSKRAVSADSVTYSIYKDTLGHYAMPVDSGKVTATTAPSFAVSAGRGFVNYFLRVCANAGNHAPGRYTALIEAWDDTCSQMHIVWWDCYTDSTTHEYAKNNRIIGGAVKAKTDSSSYAAGGHIKSTPQTDVTVDGASIGSIAGGVWVLNISGYSGAGYAGTYLHHTRDAVKDSIEKAMTHFHAIIDSLNAVLDSLQAGFGSRTAIGDTAQRNAAVAGNAMTLTAAERKAIADSVHFADTTQYSGTDTTMGQMAINAATIAIGDTNTNPFQAETDNVFLTGNYAQIANDNYDTMFVHKTDFHSTGFASPSDVRTQCADAFSDSGYTLSRAGNLDNLDETISGLDDNPWNNAKTDTASGMGDWFADWFKADYWLTAMGFATHSAADVWAEDTGGVALTKYGGAVLDHNDYRADTDTSNIKTLMQQNWDPDTDGEFSVEAGAGGADTSQIKTLMQNNWDSDTDGELSVETSTGADSTAMKTMFQNNWDPDTDGLLSVELTTCGSGANSVIIRCKSSVDSASIPGATVAIWNNDETVLLRLLGADVDSGKVTFNLDNGTYKVRATQYKFQFGSPIIIGVSGNKDTTIYATEFTPTPPPSIDLCTVYGYIDSIGLGRDRAKISVTIHAQNLRVGTKILAYGSYTKSVYTDVHGYWEMFLPPNADITPAGTVYHFTIEIPGMETVEKYLTVPDLTTWEFTW